jgi:NAD(P)-dependent dehydrogenase (short-subunit alcohol dehydrogenase family)
MLAPKCVRAKGNGCHLAVFPFDGGDHESTRSATAVPGASVISTNSVNSDMPKPTLLPYATTKGAIVNYTAGLAQLLADKGIRANSVAPGPIWTPLIFLEKK